MDGVVGDVLFVSMRCQRTDDKCRANVWLTEIASGRPPKTRFHRHGFSHSYIRNKFEVCKLMCMCACARACVVCVRACVYYSLFTSLYFILSSV